ncbi:hypothetical protein OPV09_02655 [Janthinobacterium sp. TB1-E2]|uniref:Uncharacterized protein n=1 Tax=Janthinobacterium aestuarii TaxID=2985511 RepID=A0ABZ2GNM6_9BURK
MLHEFAVSPDIFLASAFDVKTDLGEFIPAETHGHLALTSLLKGIERFGVIRNLSGGMWWGVLDGREDGLHPRSREVLKKLKSNGRVVHAPARMAGSPAAEKEWLAEAVASHGAEPKITQFFGTDEFCASLNAADHKNLPAGISKIPYCLPFSGGGCSIKVKRDIDAYIEVLRPLIKYSRSLMFIDPYLDLAAPNYKDFVTLLETIAAINPDAEVELHRQIKPAPREPMRTASDWKQSFHQVIAANAALNKLSISVFVWDEFHDRYLVSNLMGISVPYGFDTTSKDEATRWSMLSTQDANDVREEFTEGDPHDRRKLQRT